MSLIEIILLVFGFIVFIGSFLIPAKEKKTTGAPVSEEVVHRMVEKELENAKGQISDIVEETVSYAMEKTERSMDRLTNEKMMAVNEYSDTVLEEIHKNHKEVVFLYDMLNEKNESLKNTIPQVEKTAKEVKQTVKDAEITAKDFIPFAPEKVEIPQEEAPKPARKKRVSKVNKETVKEQEEKTPAPATGKAVSAPTAEVPDVTVSLDQVGKTTGRNSNERILELHKSGKSNMAIAKELGLGIGEVKLVIDLFEGM